MHATRYNDRALGQQPQLVRQERITGIYLGANRLVVRRQTFDGVRDATVDKFERIIR
jgi:hypothetical protein